MSDTTHEVPDRIWIDKVHGQHPEYWNFTDGKGLTKRQKRGMVEYVHIDELNARLNTMSALWAKEAAEKNVLAGRCENLEAKLAKVMERLQDLAEDFDKPRAGLTDFGERQHYLYLACRLRDKARTTLAELKGQDDE